MIVEVQRMVSDWLGHEDLARTDGVNDLISTVPRDGGDPEPAALEGVYDETRDDFVAAREDPPVSPSLYVIQDAPFTLEGEVQTQIRRAEGYVLAIWYLTHNWDTALGVQAASYTLRAVVKSLRALTEADSSTRTRNKICLEEIDDLLMVPVVEAVGESSVLGGIMATLTVRDGQP